MNLSNEEIISLVQKCANGDSIALKKFFEIFSTDIYNFPIRVFHLDEDDASEFFIYAFERLKTGKRFQTFVSKAGFRTWLYTVLRNLLIDWQRNKKELKTVANYKVNVDGDEYSTIETEMDTRPEKMEEANSVSTVFTEILDDLKLDQRILFKMVYIFYLNLNPDEMEYVTSKRKISKQVLLEEINQIRDELSEKEIHNIELEDKISAIYMSIIRLQEKLKKEPMQEFQDNLPNLNKTKLAIEKKYEQRKKLIERKQKGNLISKTPYKVVAKILDIPENNISISLLRIIEKIQKKIIDFEI